ncbi:MAG: ABC transporter permease [Lachnospiraceae bacterium]|nr:ABC transporter permease [Lachnospiraceae bacterium]
MENTKPASLPVLLKSLLASLGQALLLVAGITFLSFLLTYLSPGDPAEQMLRKGGMMVSEEAVEKKREELGLNEPMLVRYGLWVKNLIQGNLGNSYKSRKSVASELASALPYTVSLTALSMLFVVLFATPVGILCARWQNGVFDNVWRGITYLFSSLPSFFISLLLMYVFALRLGWLPVIAGKGWKGILMPAMALAAPLSAWYIRQIRAIVLREIEKGYIDGLRSRGIPERTILFRHVLKNSLLPLVTLFGISVGNMLGGTTIVESIFSWPGVGRLAVESITARDYPMIQGYVVWMALIFLAVNFLVDASYRFLDPRVRRGGA